MREQLILTKQFKKSYNKFSSKNSKLKNAISQVLMLVEKDAYHPTLKTHKLSGKLASYLACSCGYDCRIIFIIEKDILDSEVENIILLDIGTHDEVY